MISKVQTTSKLKAFFREYRAEVTFIVIFVVGLLIGFKLIYSETVSDHVIYPLTVAESAAASAVLNLIGFPNEQEGNRLRGTEGKPFHMEVRNNCNGVYESVVFLMAFIAIQIPWRKKFGWMLAGFAMFHTINLMRLVSLFIVGSRFSMETFVFFHETFWNYALIILTLGIFLFCAMKVGQSYGPETGKEAESS